MLRGESDENKSTGLNLPKSCILKIFCPILNSEGKYENSSLN